MKSQILIAVFILVSSQCYAQNHWYSGQNQTTLSPFSNTVGSGAFINEGAAMIDDVSGNPYLLSDGQVLYKWNGSSWVITNFLAGDNSAAQASVILRQPGSSGTYYIFVTKGWQHGNGLWYYTYNGTTISSAVSLDNLACEQLTSVCDGAGGYWIISHRTGSTATTTSKKYIAFHLNSSGVLNTTPVISNGIMAYPYNTSSGNRYGSITFSPSGQVLCNTFGGSPVADNNTVELVKFNNATGMFSNPVILLKATSNIPKKVAPTAYCAEFSPNGNVLYVASAGASSIYQFNLMAGSGVFTTPGPVVNSRFILNNGTSVWSVKRNPFDGKIYAPEQSAFHYSVISSPNLLGASCGFAVNLINTAQNGGEFTQTPPTCACTGDTINLGDEIICAGSFFPLCNQTFTVPGPYTVTCMGLDGCQHTYQFILVYSSLAVNAGPDLTSCCGGVNFNAIGSGGAPPYTYSWTPTGGLSNPNIANPVCSLAGTYTVTVTDSHGCTASDQIKFSYSTPSCCRIGGHDESPEEKAQVFPNPFTDHFTLKIPGKMASKIFVYDRLGNVVETYNNQSGDIGIGNKLPSGSYTLQVIYIDGKSEQIKIIKTEN